MDLQIGERIGTVSIAICWHLGSRELVLGLEHPRMLPMWPGWRRCRAIF